MSHVEVADSNQINKLPKHKPSWSAVITRFEVRVSEDKPLYVLLEFILVKGQQAVTYCKGWRIMGGKLIPPRLTMRGKLTTIDMSLLSPPAARALYRAVLARVEELRQVGTVDLPTLRNCSAAIGDCILTPEFLQHITRRMTVPTTTMQ